MVRFGDFDRTIDTDWRHARLHAHYAAQLVAAAGRSVLGEHPEFLHSALRFDPVRRALVGVPLTAGREVRLLLPSLTLEVASPVGTRSYGLRGRGVQAAASWLEEVLGTPLVFPDWDLPEGEPTAFGPVRAADGALERLTGWFEASHAFLTSWMPPQGEPSVVRVWPHHFDIAVLVTLTSRPDGDDVTVGVGMTPADEGIDVPYLYVTPWPYPDAWAAGALTIGRWQTEGWFGAVLEAPEVTGDGDVSTFMTEAFAHAARVAKR